MSLLSSSPLLDSKNVPLDRISPTFSTLVGPMEAQFPHLPELVSGSNRPLDYTFGHQARALVYYHTEAFSSGQALLQAAHEDPLARQVMVPDSGLGKTTFYEANATRGCKQMLVLVNRLSKKVSKHLHVEHLDLGPLRAIDGSLIEASLSMAWAEYSSTQRKAKAHVGFNLNQGLPWNLALTEGKGAERPFVSSFLEAGETGVMDRGYVDYQRFDDWIDEGKHFVARIRKNAQYEILERLPIPSGTKIFFFAKVRLGDDAHRMSHPVWLVGFKSRGKIYWIATDRADLSADQIAFIFALRWEIETFFAWWKRHLKVYHLISRNYHGVLLQLLAGLATYLLLVLYFHQKYGERPSLQRLRSLRQQIRQEANTTFVPVYIPVYTIDIELIFFSVILLLWIQDQAKS
jgi:hypothetical protein